MADSNNQKKSFKDTLNLPHTNFPIRSNHKEDDPRLIERWATENINTRALICIKDKKNLFFTMDHLMLMDTLILGMRIIKF